MNILLVNDDGYFAKGILELRDFLVKKGHEVIIFAPLLHQSGASSSISIDRPLTLKRIEEKIFAIDGRPSDVVSFALSSFKKYQFDLVISGINIGYNISFDTMYSGTLGAANEALNLGKKVIAISANTSLKNVSESLEIIWNYLNEKDIISNQYILNINIPATDKIKGVKITTLANAIEKPYYLEKNGEFYRHREIEYQFDSNSDYQALKDGYISITPLNNNTFSQKYYNKLSEN